MIDICEEFFVITDDECCLLLLLLLFVRVSVIEEFFGVEDDEEDDDDFIDFFLVVDFVSLFHRVLLLFLSVLIIRSITSLVVVVVDDGFGGNIGFLFDSSIDLDEILDTLRFNFIVDVRFIGDRLFGVFFEVLSTLFSRLIDFRSISCKSDNDGARLNANGVPSVSYACDVTKCLYVAIAPSRIVRCFECINFANFVIAFDSIINRFDNITQALLTTSNDDDSK
ncbi:hypothetical protein DERP_005092 [Dermatophagoides pteronyssinus]|uniref:Uncharacterized protein n=1 Tax=Dermatophagoides pteronyssinus TaxID=6956 RepID=A0ABQ8JTC9_DERPT|nr:hypothetical protein DERP_005092 [Dermatophagoides pteronyssinus]